MPGIGPLRVSGPSAFPPSPVKAYRLSFSRAHTGTPYDYGGMGVGLYISNEIIRRHGGRMWFESEEGKGSTFYFILPMEGPIA